MTQTLEYESPVDHPPSRVLAFFAHATAAYPLLVIGSLYGHWLLCWWVLGHAPRPSLDDPKFISGTGWMYAVSFYALWGFLPAGCIALALNTWYVIDHRRRPFLMLVHATLAATLWLSTFVMLLLDPGGVLYWWAD